MIRVVRGLESGTRPRISRCAWARALVVLTSVSAVHAADGPTPTIPLCPGLQIVTAISQPNGDYESIKTVLAVDEQSVQLRYSSEYLVTDLLAADFGQLRKSTLDRVVRRADLASATLYQQRFITGMPTLIPETTAISTSSAVLRALRTSGRSEFSISSAYAGEFPADRKQSPSLYDFMTPGELVRIDKAPRVSIVINDSPISLPVMRARGEFAGESAEFVFLDDDTHPLTLKFRVGIDAEPPMDSNMKELCRTMQSAAPELGPALCGRDKASDRETLEVVKIVHRCTLPGALAGQPSLGQPSPPASQLERDLEANGKAVIYDIHFSFNSERIREESEPRLAEIAGVLRKHPNWTLVVNGHTDSIGGDRYNLGLAQRRAAAVKEALVRKHGIAPARLLTNGFGASQPRDTNDTLAGRARNRRVELIKQ